MIRSSVCVAVPRHLAISLAAVALAAGACRSGSSSQFAEPAAPVELQQAAPARELVELVRSQVQRPAVKASANAAGSAEPARVPALPPSAVDRVDASLGRLMPHVREEARTAAGLLAEVSLPRKGTGEMRVRDTHSELSISVSLRGARDVEAELADGLVVYRQGHRDGADLIHRVTAEGAEDYLYFSRAPAAAEVSYDVALGAKVAGLRLVENVLEFLDGQGAPRLRVSPPYLIDARGQHHSAQLAVEGCGYDASPAAPWDRPVVDPGARSCAVRVRWGGQVAYPALLDPLWTSTSNNLATARYSHTATKLSDGRVLVAGGYTGSTGAAAFVAAAEIYDPATNSWAATGSLALARTNHSASGPIATATIGTTTVANGVLVAGGSIWNTTTNRGDVTPTAELYNPASGTWLSAASMITARYNHVAVLLGNGKVLAAGGMTATSELWSPSTNTWAATKNSTTAATTQLSVDRTEAVAAVLPSGKVLVAGGYSTANYASESSCELYDPFAGTWAASGFMNARRAGHAGAMITGNKLLVSGGYQYFNWNGTTTWLASAETYDPVGGTWTAVGAMASKRRFHTLTTLANGKVLAVGGDDTYFAATTAELYDPGTTAWTATASPKAAREYATATLLSPGNKVLIAGGTNAYGGTSVATAEIYGQYSLGTTCAAANDCTSGFCSFGICCDAACTGGACQRCDVNGSVGTCITAPLGDPGSPGCGFYVCDGAALTCPTNCTADSGCTAGYYCSKSGTCAPQLAQAAACDLTADCKVTGCRECATGHCQNGVCCDRACNGPGANCERCDLASSKGTCTTAPLSYAGAPTCSPYACDGTRASCPTSCAGDAGCGTGYFCNGGTCMNKFAQGASCMANSWCSSGNCVDGFCCSAACGPCGACSAAKGATANGQCTYFASGNSGTPSCQAYVCSGGSAACPTSCTSDSACAAGYFCAASGTCQPQVIKGGACNPASDCKAGGCQECATGHCVDGVCCDSACGACGACSTAKGAATNGTCTNSPAGSAGQPSCTPLLCGGASPLCPTSCGQDSDCIAGDWCDGSGHCVAQLSNGGACLRGSQCQSGFCADGFCCNNACDMACASCALNGSRGTCLPVTGSPVGGRSCAGAGSTCGGSCNGVSPQCQYPGASTQCRAPSCTAGSATPAVGCDGAGSCPAADPVACAPYLCGTDGKCRSSCTGDGHCQSDAFCSGTSCKLKGALGASCASASGCQSGFCADGVCCGKSCDGQCEACNGKTSPGTCAPVTGAPVGARQACAGSGACAGSCDGSSAKACAFPGATKVCAEPGCTDGAESAASTCDGTGKCSPGATTSCPAGCDGAKCAAAAPPSDAGAASSKGCGCGSAGSGDLGFTAFSLASFAGLLRRRRRAA